MTTTAAALALCLATPAPQTEVIAQLVHDGYRFDQAASLEGGVLLVRTVDADGTVAWMLVWPNETACRTEDP